VLVNSGFFAAIDKGCPEDLMMLYCEIVVLAIYGLFYEAACYYVDPRIPLLLLPIIIIFEYFGYAAACIAY
jgi:hypothetical protein